MLVPSHVISLALIRLPALNALTGPSDYLSVSSKVDCCMLERYSHEYYLSHVLGLQVPYSSSYALDALPDNVSTRSCTCPVSHEPILESLWLTTSIIYGSKCTFQLTGYLAGDIPPESIVVDDVVPDQKVDQVTVTPGSPLALPGFGSDAFSIEQLLDTSCPVIGSAQVSSSSYAGVVSPIGVSFSRKHRRVLLPDQFLQVISHVGGRRSCVLFEEELNEACRFIACAEKIISSVLGRDFQFFDVLLTLRDRFLVVEVNVRATEAMNLASEEMLVKVVEMYADLSTRYQDAAAKVTSLENQGTLVQAKYEACLQENIVLHSEFFNKS
ncbi:unnamed protein product [Lactuca virosa]|uniref:ATP-grasp domain-containing protein n=1 Tax=Lactuca virosa TaxID=75947 RepID=A0AAU9M8V2_9ASTR|nr:unnamed protein product [Lactuca virosa]